LSESIKLIEKILSEANTRAEQETAASKLKADEIIAKAKAKADTIISKAKTYAEGEAVERQRRVKSVYDLEHKKNILAMKRDVLDIAFKSAVDDVAKLSDEKYEDMMQKLLISCATDGKGAIKVAKSDVNRLGADFVKSANDALKKSVGTGEVTLLSETCDKKGGFIYVSGGMEMDCSIEAVATLERENIETQAAEILFNKE
jgi:V/A-type H+/Na+-transporting ATPase subunit E